MPPTFLYHAEAVGASGRITLPIEDAMPMQASLGSPVGEGYGSVRVESFKHLDYLSLGPIESKVVGSHSARDAAHGTLSTVSIEKLNILDVVTCDRLITRLTSKHPEDGSSQASFILYGTRFENLRIAGYQIDLNLAIGLFSQLGTFEKLNTAYQTDPAIRAELSQLAMYPVKGERLPVSNGIFGCTLAHIPDELPGGLTRNGQGIYVPHFGTVYPAQFYITEGSRRLRMLHVELGCSVEGCYGFGDTGANGSQYPGGTN